MTVTGVVIIALAVMIVLLVSKTPVALALGITGVLGLTLLKGFGHATNVLGSTPFSQVSSFTLTIVPMFILMGMFAVRAKIAEQVFAIANRFVAKAPGGLGVATIMACAGFSAVSGSSIGTAATMSKLSVAEMRANGYPASLATALVAVAGTLGAMIPPSTFLVLYAIMANVSVSQMLAAGIVPGVLSALAYIAYIMLFGHRKIGKSTDKDDLQTVVGQAYDKAVIAAQGTGTATLRRAPADAQPGPRTSPGSLPWRGLVRVIILFAIVLGGMYSGIFTSTESAAIGALAALAMLILENRRQGPRVILRLFKEALQDTGSTTAMVFMIIVGSALLSAFFIAAKVPDAITSAVADIGLPAKLTMALLLLCLIPLGMVLESLSILVISVPILLPIALEFGFDPIWLGIIIVKLIEIGMVTPPVGINCFVVAGSTGVRTETVFKGLLPFFTVDVLITTLLFLVPALTLFLPSLVKNG
ncbi:TRAP transporter large permease [Arthrobacter koreensis]|uniref:TRAP transporter large permease n=1 Tax=Arthrobacter koreensis TaxID=199136 RepID=UPI0036D78B99